MNSPPVADDGAYHGLTGLVRNLLAGLRVALFLPVRGGDFRASPGQYALLVAFNAALWIAVSALQSGFAGQLNPVAVSLFLANVPLVLAAALGVAAVYGKRELLVVVAVGLTASDAWFGALSLGIDLLPAEQVLRQALPGVLLAWLWLAKMRAVAVCAGTHRPQFYRAAALATVLLALAAFAVPRAQVWLPREADLPGSPALGDERLFHLQGDLIGRELSALRPSRPALPELYFVGFAPDGHDDVFLRELRYVKKLFDERYGTHGRSIALANNEKSLEEYPLATVTNLRRTLERVGMLMNPEKDTLFLFITGHGDEDHRLPAFQPPLVLND
ncbi:MAG: hypothetical protein OEW21_17895, partial [Betaproteobacteria bacterium]|nr:hypothetical protein [Betaproteobacteria bacterium]